MKAITMDILSLKVRDMILILNIDNWHSIEPEHYFAFNTSDFNVMPWIPMYLNQMSEAHKNKMEQDYSYAIENDVFEHVLAVAEYESC